MPLGRRSSELGAGTCGVAAFGALSADSVVVSPDGRNVYSSTYNAELGVFSRNTTTGALTQLAGTAGCLNTTGGSCTQARGMRNANGDGRDIVITPDGAWAYLAVQGGGLGGVLIFQRNPATGALTQPVGTAGCITNDGSSQIGPGDCQTDGNLSRPTGVSLSPDARFLYVVDYGGSNFIHVFARSVTTGALSDVQCIAEVVQSGCSVGRVLGNSQSVAITPDGLHAYGGDYGHGISVFNRDPATGLLTQKPGIDGCVTNTGKDNLGAATCAVGRVLSGAYPLTLTPDGHTLYVPARNDNGISVFHLNADGTLTQLPGPAGCVTKTGKDNLGLATCATGRGLVVPYGGQVSPDGLTFYTTADTTIGGGIAAFAVDPATGALSQLAGLAGCTTNNATADGTVATAGQCTQGRALSFAYGFGLSPDGTSVYVAADDSGSGGGVAVFTRQANPICVATSASAAHATPVTVALSCASPNGEPVAVSTLSTPSHGSLSALNAAAHTVTYTPASSYTGSDSFTFRASDGTNQSATAIATVTVAPAAATAPRLTKLKESAHTWREGNNLASITRKRLAPVGTTFTFTLSQTARVKLTFDLRQPGKRSHHQCVKPTKSNRHAKSCTRLKLAGTLTLSAHAGTNRIKFQGKLSKHSRLPPGNYQVALVATNTHGQKSKPQTLGFTIVKR